jgi:chemotaxis protein MotB
MRQILDADCVRVGNIFVVAGNADSDPLFPDDPHMSPNRCVTTTLMCEEPLC